MSTIPGFELASFQRAMRTVLAHPLITEQYPDAGALPLVRWWADQLRPDLVELFDYRLELSRTTARLIRVADTLDASMPAVTARDRPFDRRRYAYRQSPPIHVGSASSWNDRIRALEHAARRLPCHLRDR